MNQQDLLDFMETSEEEEERVKSLSLTDDLVHGMTTLGSTGSCIGLVVTLSNFLTKQANNKRQ